MNQRSLCGFLFALAALCVGFGLFSERWYTAGMFHLGLRDATMGGQSVSYGQVADELEMVANMFAQEESLRSSNPEIAAQQTKHINDWVRLLKRWDLLGSLVFFVGLIAVLIWGFAAFFILQSREREGRVLLRLAQTDAWIMVLLGVIFLKFGPNAWGGWFFPGYDALMGPEEAALFQGYAKSMQPSISMGVIIFFGGIAAAFVASYLQKSLRTDAQGRTGGASRAPKEEPPRDSFEEIKARLSAAKRNQSEASSIDEVISTSNEASDHPSEPDETNRE